MALKLNDPAPNFTAASTHGDIDFHKWIGESWALFFSHPKDFTPVCTTELGQVANMEQEFKKRNCIWGHNRYIIFCILTGIFKSTIRG